MKKLHKQAGMMMMNAGPFFGGLAVGIIIAAVGLWFLLGQGILAGLYCPAG